MKITGILLAGGMSKRMGKDKGLVKIGNRFLYQYPLKVLEALCDEILISTCKDLTIPETHTTVCDEIDGVGPIGGIYTCLKRSSNDLAIVLSYDLPLINTGLLTFLLRECEAYDIVLPALQENRPEPLCGIYRKNVANILGDMIEKRRYAVHGALPFVRNRIILIEKQMPFFRPDIFLNINEESDLDRLPPGFGNENRIR